MYQNETHVLCLENLKQAALYFDRVVPVQFLRLQGHPEGSYVEVPDKIPTTVISELIYGPNTEEWRILEFMDKKWAPFIRKLHEDFEDFNGGTKGFENIYQLNPISKTNIPARDYFIEFATSLGITDPQLLISQDQQQVGFKQAYLSLSLDSIQLVDIGNASWEQIIEFRKDADAKSKLRNLRLFIYESYMGKPQAFIVDDLSKRLENYEASAKKHGFELTTSVLTAVLDSKTLQASLAAGIGAAFFGGAELALGAALAVEIGKGSLELAKREYAFREIKNTHELAYIIKAKENFK